METLFCTIGFILVISLLAGIILTSGRRLDPYEEIREQNNDA